MAGHLIPVLSFSSLAGEFKSGFLDLKPAVRQQLRSRRGQAAAGELMAGEHDKQVGVGLKMKMTQCAEGQQASRAQH